MVILMGCSLWLFVNSLLLKMAIEIVDLPIDSMVIFHSYVTVYQRVSWEQLLSLFHDILEYDWNITGILLDILMGSWNTKFL